MLIVEGSNSVIEKNEISHNIECNVAVGGKYSHHSALIDNLIADSPGVGIYIIRSGRIKIVRNDIARNRDGIILSSSQAEVQGNHLY